MSQKTHFYSSFPQRLKTTSDLEIIKDEADQLQNGSHPFALDIAEKAGLPGATFINHSQCLEALSRYYGYSSYYEFHQKQKLFQEYCYLNQLRGVWRGPQDKKWRRAIFNRQCAALIESAETGLPVAEAAKKQGVNFEGFHFSSFLYYKTFKDQVRLDFSHLEAAGCYLHRSWYDCITSFRGAKLAYAKFYDVDVGGVIGPGIHYWMMDAVGADLTGADLRNSYLRSSNFYRATLSGADFRNANIHDCIFDGAKGFYTLGEEDMNVTLSWFSFPKRHC